MGIFLKPTCRTRNGNIRKKTTLLLEFQWKPLSIASISPVLQLQISACCLGCLQGIITWLNVLPHVWKMVYTWCSIWIWKCVRCVYIYDYVYTCRCIACMCLSVFEHGINAPKQHLNVQNQHYNVTGKMFISQIYINLWPSSKTSSAETRSWRPISNSTWPDGQRQRRATFGDQTSRARIGYAQWNMWMSLEMGYTGIPKKWTNVVI